MPFPAPAETLTAASVHLVRALDLVEVAVLVQGREAEILYANRHALELLGRSYEDTIGRTSSDVTSDVVDSDGHPLAAAAQPVWTVLRTKEPVRDATIGVRLPGAAERAWLSVGAYPNLDEDGEVVEVVVTLRDITREYERRDLLLQTQRDLEHAVEVRATELVAMERELLAARAQREAALSTLAEGEAIHATVVDVMSEGVVVHDSSGGLRTCNVAAQRILGHRFESAPGGPGTGVPWTFTDLDGEPLPPERVPSEHTRVTGEPCRNVLLGVARDGQPHTWLRMNTTPLIGPSGLEGVATTFADVTEERNAHLALAESRAAFERVTEAMPGVIYELTRAGCDRISFVSAGTYDLFGVTARELTDDIRTLYAVVHPDDGTAVLAPAPGISDKAWEREFRIERDEGWRWLRCEAVRGDDLETEVWTGVVMDITDERQVAEKLKHAQRREAMGDLAAGVAHNFNNVLAAILPNLEDLRGSVGAELEPMVDDALQAARGAADMVRQLMLTTRREPAGVDCEVDVGRVCKEVVNLCRRSFDRRIAISLEQRHPGATVVARPSDLHQILLNLCINARDAMFESPDPTLQVLIERPAQGAPHDVAISVRDNGHGMSEEVQRHLGEPFFTTKAPGKGTGLGLATVYSIVQGMNADLVCRSAPGEGTSFTLTMAGVAQPAPESMPMSLPSARRSFAGRRALLVDDDALVRRAVARHLRRYDLDVVEATDGLDGLAKFRELDHVDMVVLDLSMPGASGHEVLASIRMANATVPVIVMTGFVPEGTPLSDATAVLIKPIDLDALVRELRRATKLSDTVLPPTF